MSARLQRITLGLLAALLLLGSALATYQLILELGARQQTQWQRAELQDVKYGLLDADVWVEQLSLILAEQIEQFELTEHNRPQIERNLELVLDRMLVEIEQVLRRRNAAGDSWVDRLQGSLRQGVQDWLVDFDQLRARVPLYADAVLEELDRPETRREIQRQLLQAIEQAAAASFTQVDRSLEQQIQQRLGCERTDACVARLTEIARTHLARAQVAALWSLGGISLLFLLAWLGPKLQPEIMLMLSAATLVLLSAGVMTPMIEVEARIDQLSLSLLGRPILFTDQVLYFQSKSILDLVQVLAATGAADMLLVALLVVLFSLLFPLAKILASLLYYLNPRGLREHPLIGFFALRSGKWSMADVLVVAILMAYVGFDGLINSQLAELSGLGQQVDLLTTNGTQLQLGFFLFLAFVLASLLLSTLLEARAPGSTRPSSATNPARPTRPAS
jgi:hypothetical protein